MGQPNCIVDNATADGLGMTNFNSSLSPNRPLTWTVFVKTASEEDFSMEKDFLLGTPSAMNLATSGVGDNLTTTIKYACALFFEGISTKLKFPGNDLEDDQGTCGDALTPSCVTDLLSQTHLQMKTIFNSTHTDDTPSNFSGSCEQLKNILQVNPPPTCLVATNSTWETVLARPLVGPDAATPITPDPSDNCHPTTGGPEYTLSLIMRDRMSIPDRNSDLMRRFLYGITPIMTVVYGGDRDRNEVSISCPKCVESKPNTNDKVQKSESVRTKRFEVWNRLLLPGAIFISMLFEFGGAI